MKKFQLLSCFLTVILVGCASDKTTTEVTDSATSTNISGTYLANLPCSDCRGTLVNIVLNADNSYATTVEYLDKSNELIYENGKWQKDNNYIVLNADKTQATNPSIKYLVFKGKQLVLLTPQKKPYTGKLSHRYIFEKK